MYRWEVREVRHTGFVCLRTAILICVTKQSASVHFKFICGMYYCVEDSVSHFGFFWIDICFSHRLVFFFFFFLCSFKIVKPMVVKRTVTYILRFCWLPLLNYIPHLVQHVLINRFISCKCFTLFFLLARKWDDGRFLWKCEWFREIQNKPSQWLSHFKN